MSARLGLLDLGRRPYGEVLELQRELCRRRMADELRQDIALSEKVAGIGAAIFGDGTGLNADGEALPKDAVAASEIDSGVAEERTLSLIAATTRKPTTLLLTS